MLMITRGETNACSVVIPIHNLPLTPLRDYLKVKDCITSHLAFAADQAGLCVVACLVRVIRGVSPKFSQFKNMSLHSNTAQPNACCSLLYAVSRATVVDSQL